MSIPKEKAAKATVSMENIENILKKMVNHNVIKRSERKEGGFYVLYGGKDDEPGKDGWYYLGPRAASRITVGWSRGRDSRPDFLNLCRRNQVRLSW